MDFMFWLSIRLCHNLKYNILFHFVKNNITMDCIIYKDFKNICRICLLTCDMKFLPDHVISDIYYKLSDGIPFDTNELPQQICLKCSEKINEIHAFSLQCKEANSCLTKCLNEFKNVRIKEEQDDTNVEMVEIKEEMIIEENDIEYIKVEELNLTNEIVIDEVQIKHENAKETNAINNNENINFDQVNPIQNDLNSDINERLFKCDQCPKMFTRKDNLITHKGIHSGERPYLCKICNKKFKQLRDLNKHKQIHSGERPYVCELCNKTFIRSDALNQHKRIHSGERRFVCDICNKKFTQSGALNQHKFIHSGERSFECDICSKRFNQSKYLYRHKLTHSGGERDVYEKSFKTSSILIDNSETFPYKCDVCSTAFKRMSLLKGHIQRSHDQDSNELYDY